MVPQHPHHHQQQQPLSESQQLHVPSHHATSSTLHYPQQQQQQQFVSQEAGPGHVGLVIPPHVSGCSSNDNSSGSSLNGGNGTGRLCYIMPLVSFTGIFCCWSCHHRVSSFVGTAFRQMSHVCAFSNVLVKLMLLDSELLSV